MDTCTNCHQAPEICNCQDKPGEVPERTAEVFLPELEEIWAPDPDDDGGHGFDDCDQYFDGVVYNCPSIGSEACEFCPHRHLLG